MWAVSVISGAVGLATVGYTTWTTHEGLAAAEAKIVEASKREASMQTEGEVDEKKGAPNAEPKK